MQIFWPFLTWQFFGQFFEKIGKFISNLLVTLAGGQEGRRAGGQEGRRAGGQESRKAGGQEGRRNILKIQVKDDEK